MNNGWFLWCFQVLPETCLTFYGPKAVKICIVPTCKADEFYKVTFSMFFIANMIDCACYTVQVHLKKKRSIPYLGHLQWDTL